MGLEFDPIRESIEASKRKNAEKFQTKISTRVNVAEEERKQILENFQKIDLPEISLIKDFSDNAAKLTEAFDQIYLETAKETANKIPEFVSGQINTSDLEENAEKFSTYEKHVVKILNLLESV